MLATVIDLFDLFKDYIPLQPDLVLHLSQSQVSVLLLSICQSLSSPVSFGPLYSTPGNSTPSSLYLDLDLDFDSKDAARNHKPYYFPRIYLIHHGRFTLDLRQDIFVHLDGDDDSDPSSWVDRDPRLGVWDDLRLERDGGGGQ